MSNAWWLDREAAIERNRHAHEPDPPERHQDEPPECASCGAYLDDERGRERGFCRACWYAEGAPEPE